MDLDALLRRAVELGATDMHLKEGKPPILRRDGALGPMERCGAAHDRRPRGDRRARRQGRARAAPALSQLGRPRRRLPVPRPASLPSQRLPPARVDLVRVPRDPEDGADLRRARRMPPGVARLTAEHRGLILVTGATGSGKTTTLAAMIGEINRTRQQHIVTIEDPIEILHARRPAASSTSARSASTPSRSLRRSAARFARTPT